MDPPRQPASIQHDELPALAGARMQSRLPDALIRRIVGTLVIAIAAQYLWSGLK